MGMRPLIGGLKLFHFISSKYRGTLMARTPLMRMLRNLASEHLALIQQETLGDTVHPPLPMPRRNFLKLGALAATAAMIPNPKPLFAADKRKPKIVIVGAGIAGLNAALTLQDAGIASTTYLR